MGFLVKILIIGLSLLLAIQVAFRYHAITSPPPAR